MMRVPAGILCAAKTPLPCSLERRTACQGLMGVSSEAVVMGLRAFGGDETKQNYIGASMTV